MIRLMQGGKLAAAGIAIGVAVSAGVGQLLESLLYGVSGYDLLAYGAAATVLMLVALNGQPDAGDQRITRGSCQSIAQRIDATSIANPKWTPP